MDDVEYDDLVEYLVEKYQPRLPVGTVEALDSMIEEHDYPHAFERLTLAVSMTYPFSPISMEDKETFARLARHAKESCYLLSTVEKFPAASG